MEITSLLSGIGALKQAAEIAKLIKDSGSTLEKSEIKLKFAELIDSIAEAKLSMAALKDEIESRDEKIEKLQKTLDLHEELSFRDGFYWAEGDSVPFCSRCFEVDGMAVHINKEVEQNFTIVRQCPQCDKTFHIRNNPPDLCV